MPPAPPQRGARLRYSSGIVSIWQVRLAASPEAAVAGPNTLIFPRLPVRVSHPGGPQLVADPTMAVLYRDPGAFRREALTAGGVCSDWFQFAPHVIAEAFPRGARAPAPEVVRCPAQAFMLERLLFDEAEETPGVLWIEEAAILLLGLLAQARRTRAIRPQHRDLANAAAEIMAADLAISRSLTELAAATRVSRFHLSRIFAAATGFTLTGYREQLRMRLALDRLAETAADDATVARMLGFNGLKVFRRRFRAVTGLTTAEARRRRDAGKGAAIRAALFHSGKRALDAGCSTVLDRRSSTFRHQTLRPGPTRER